MVMAFIGVLILGCARLYAPDLANNGFRAAERRNAPEGGDYQVKPEPWRGTLIAENES
jgi:hypothetical protein